MSATQTVAYGQQHVAATLAEGTLCSLCCMVHCVCDNRSGIIFNVSRPKLASQYAANVLVIALQGWLESLLELLPLFFKERHMY